LETGAICIEELECTSIHNGAKDLGAYIHEHDASPFVGVGEISDFGNRDALAAVPLFVIGVAEEEVIDMFVDVSEVCG
jgi:hypothetical protein